MARGTLRPAGKGRIAVLFRYDAGLVEKMRGIEGRRWHALERYWSVPQREGMVERLVRLLGEEEVEVDPALSRPAAHPRGVGRGGATHPAIGQMDQELVLRGYSAQTRKNYRQHAVRFLCWLGREPGTAGAGDLRRYLYEMASGGRLSAAYCNQARAALQAFYEVLREPEKATDLPRMQEPKKLPAVLSREEVGRLLRATSNLKHKALLMMAYSAGLRVGEVVRLRVSDIDSERRQIRVQGGKGQKDRYTLLSQVALEAVQAYIRAYRPQEWLFPGGDPRRPLCVRSAQHIFEQSKKRAGIQKEATFHSLRHVFATHLLEDGVDMP